MITNGIQTHRSSCAMRARLLPVVIMLLFGWGGAVASGGVTPTVEHTMHVVLDPASHRLIVEDVIRLPESVGREGAEFLLNSALTITESDPAVRDLGIVAGAGGAEKRRYALESTAEDGELRLSYSGAIDFGLGDEKEQYSRGFRETHGSLGPEGVYLDGGTAWVAAFGDEMVRFTIEVEGPDDWHVISQGNGRSDVHSASGVRTARWESGADLEQVYLVGGPLTVHREMAGSVEALVYLHDEDEALARKYLDATARYIEMYRGLIGPYPYEKFALVENFWETGYGMPSFTLLGPQVIRLPFILHSSYPHEILHNWWGNSVFVDYESGNWCEGLTAYMADHLIQEQRGVGAAYRRDALQKFRSFVRDGRDFPLNEFRSRHNAATEAVGYGKALMMFHMLRCHIGDDAFRAAMQTFYRKNRGRRAGYADIRTSVEAVTDEDFEWFFGQWVSRAGAPSLGVRDVEVQKQAGGGGYVVSGLIEQRQSDTPFVITVPIVVATESDQVSLGVHVESRQQHFSLHTNDRPVALAADPSFDVFRLLDPLEMPSSIGQIFGEPEVLAVLPSDGSAPAYRALVEGWSMTGHDVECVFDLEIESLPDDRGIWILGAANRFAPSLLAFDPEIESDGPVTSVALAEERVGLESKSVVVVRRNPRNAVKAMGWIAIDPDAAFAGIARKLPHYGKYSYLAFEGDEPTNVLKGQWGTDDSPMVVEFDRGASSRISLPPSAALAELAPVFSQRRLQSHVEWLAAPERGGRGLGSPGLEASANYIAEQFEAAGLVPGGDDGGWYQHFTVESGPNGRATAAMNVVGILRGTRLDWSEQSIVVGAHFDHLGLGWPDVHAGDEGQVHPGADDNASGVAVLMELAHIMAADGGSRHLVFVAFSGEESGLHGSRHYVANPCFPVDGMRGMINMDTVGRLHDGEIHIHASGTADEWQHIFRGVGFVTGIRSRNIADAIGGSDQDSFIAAGVPAVQFFTGAHTDYHRPSDTADRVDHAGLVKVATFARESLAYLCEREPPMQVRIEGTATEQAVDAGTGDGRRVSFGTLPQFDFPGPGVKVESVMPGSPAERAGVLPGDVLIRIDETEISDLRRFSEFLKTLAPGDEVSAVLRRADVEVIVPVRVVAR